MTQETLQGRRNWPAAQSRSRLARQLTRGELGRGVRHKGTTWTTVISVREDGGGSVRLPLLCLLRELGALLKDLRIFPVKQTLLAPGPRLQNGNHDISVFRGFISLTWECVGPSSSPGPSSEEALGKYFFQFKELNPQDYVSLFFGLRDLRDGNNSSNHCSNLSPVFPGRSTNFSKPNRLGPGNELPNEISIVFLLSQHFCSC